MERQAHAPFYESNCRQHPLVSRNKQSFQRRSGIATRRKRLLHTSNIFHSLLYQLLFLMFNFYWVNPVSFIVNVTSIALINIIEENKCLGVNLPNNMLLQNYPQKYGFLRRCFQWRKNDQFFSWTCLFLNCLHNEMSSFLIPSYPGNLW